MLIVVQSLAIGLTVAILTPTASRHFPSPRGLVLPGALGLSSTTAPGVQYGALFDFHEVALGCRSSRGHWPELAWTALAVKVIIPALSPNHAWAYAGAVRGIGEQLHTAWVAFVVDHGLTRTITLLALPVVFACFASPLVLALLPGLASRALTDNPNYWQIFNHYNLVPATIVSFAALDGLRRLRAHARLRTLAIVVMLVVAAVSCATGPTVMQTTRPVTASRLADAQRAIDSIPAGAPVAADAYLTPHLTRSHPITQQIRPALPNFPVPYTDDLLRPLVADYLVFDLAATSNLQDEGDWIQPAIEHFQDEGFVERDRFGDFLVLERG